MRTRLLALFVMASLAAVPVGAQETRGNINGTVQDASGVVPGATVTITNVDNGQTQTLVTNGTGYFEAPLLQALGGSIYAGDPGATGLSWKGESMWMPRVSGAYTLTDRTVIKGGYGLFFDSRIS
jgi:hypothetical protein